MASGSFDNSGSIAITAGSLSINGGSGSDAYAQIGHGGDNFGAQSHLSAASLGGDIVVSGTTGVTLAGGTGSDAYTQIGHGGADAFIQSTIAGTLGVSGTVSVAASQGAIALTGGSGTAAYAQIGHGGVLFTAGTTGTLAISNGDITVTAQGNIALTGGDSGGGGGYAQIGDGGFDFAEGSTAGGGPTVAGALSVSSSAGTISLSGGNGSSGEDYVQIGDGGYAASGADSGNISIGASGGLSLTGGGGGDANAYAQIGHGGTFAVGSDSGDITIDIGGALSLDGGAGSGTYAQIGHGGFNSNDTAAAGDLTNSGTITVTAGSVSLLGGSGSDAYAQIGHGGDGSFFGANSGGAISDSGNISVTTTTGGITVTGGTNNNAYAQIGHGGANSFEDATAGSIMLTGTITLGSAGVVDVIGGGMTGGASSGDYAQIGHGGFNSDSSGFATSIGNAGNITITAASVTLRGGSDPNGNPSNDDHDAYAQIGHGGDQSFTVETTINGISDTGNISITTSGGVTLQGGNGNSTYAQIGHGGFATGTNSFSSGTVTLGGTITISTTTSAGNVSLSGGTGLNSYAQIGHGGDQAFLGSIVSGNGFIVTGDINVIAGGAVSVLAGTVLDDYAQIGHGGWSAFQNIGFSAANAGFIGVSSGSSPGTTSNITVSGTSISLAGSSGAFQDDYAQIGHGGVGALDGVGATQNIVSNIVNPAIGFAGNISVTATGTNGAVSLSGNSAEDGYAQIGHGGFNAETVTNGFTTATNSGTITVSASGSGGSITLSGGTYFDAYAQIGHGGAGSFAAAPAGADSGNINVQTASGNITLTGGTSASSYAQIGHGAVTLDNNATEQGNIDVRAAGTLTLSSGTGGAVIGSRTGLANGVSNTNVYVAAHSLVADGVTDVIGSGSNFAAMLTSDLDADAGEVVLALGDGFSIGSLSFTNTSAFGGLALLSQGEVTDTGALANTGAGPIELVGGWDGSTGVSPVPGASAFNFGAVMADPAAYGNGNFGVTLGADITIAATSADSGIAIAGPTVLASNVTLAAGSGIVGLFSTVDAQSPGGESLTVSGNAIFGGAVGGTSALSSLGVAGTTDLDGGVVITTGTQSYGGAVTLGVSTTLTGTSISFTSTVDGQTDGAQALTVDGNAVLDGAVGAGTALSSLAITGTTALNGGLVTTSGGQTYSGAVTLGADAMLSDNAGGAVTFDSTIDGAHALMVDTAGTTSFDGNIGAATPLASLTVAGPAVIEIGNYFSPGTIATSGGQTYSGTVTLGSTDPNDYLNSGTAYFEGGTITFDGAVTGASVYETLDTSGAATTVLNGGSVTMGGGQNYGNLILGADTTLSSTNFGFITFNGTVDSAAGTNHSLTVNDFRRSASTARSAVRRRSAP